MPAAPYDYQKKFFSPRLLDYVLIVGTRHPNRNDSVVQTPELLRRYPLEDHPDFPLPPDVVFFCQPEGCVSVGPRRLTLRDSSSFVYALTEKDSGRTRYGICVNFYRPFERRRTRSRRLQRPDVSSISPQPDTGGGGELLQPDLPRTSQRSDGDQSPGGSSSGKSSTKQKRRRKRRTVSGRSLVKNNTLTSLCIISHHPFFSTFRDCLHVLRKLIDACNARLNAVVDLRRSTTSSNTPLGQESAIGSSGSSTSSRFCDSSVLFIACSEWLRRFYRALTF